MLATIRSPDTINERKEALDRALRKIRWTRERSHETKRRCIVIHFGLSWFPAHPARKQLASNIDITMCNQSISKLPDELLREIFLQATLIRGEWDVSTNYFHTGLFCSHDEYQIDAWEHVLPDRLNIAKVCRQWHQVGVEFLYATFHRNRARDRTRQGRVVSLFRALLEARPEIGHLVKRLSLDFDPDDNADQVAIISLCPNLIIFSSLRVYSTTRKWWAPTLFPSTLRQFDSSLRGPTWATVVPVLNNIPGLEILHLYFDGPSPVKDSDYPMFSLPSLRVLQLYMSTTDATLVQTFGHRLHLPRLVALSFSLPSTLHPTGFTSPFPAQLLRRVVSLNTWRYPSATRAEDLVSLRHLTLEDIASDDFTTLVPHIPFHTVRHIVFRPPTPPILGPIDPWLSRFYDQMCFPLNPTAMPMLCVLELEWGLSLISIDSHSKFAELLSLLKLLATEFEQRGVQFINKQQDLRKGPERIKDIVYSIQQEDPGHYSNETLEKIARSFPWGAREVGPSCLCQIS
jgi:hypothetical protein